MRFLTAILWSVMLALLTAPAAAQESRSGDASAGDPTATRVQAQSRIEVHDPSGEPAQEMIRERILRRLRETENLDAGQRARMEQHLERALQHGFSGDQIDGMFPRPGRERDLPAEQILRLQEQVIVAADDGAPAGLLADKLQEGRMKGASAAAIEGALTRLEQHVRAAHRTMERATEQGLEPTADQADEWRLQRGLALDLWRGLGEGDLGHLTEQARKRARAASCSTTQLAAAAETATELIEMGVDPLRARETLGLGLQRGYTAQEMRRLGAMVRAAARRGDPPAEVLDEIEKHLRDGRQYQEMTREMARHGWMGPSDTGGTGSGGRSPVDDVINGPGRHGAGSGSGEGGPGGPGSSDPGDGGPGGPGGPDPTGGRGDPGSTGGTGGTGSPSGGRSRDGN